LAKLAQEEVVLELEREGTVEGLVAVPGIVGVPVEVLGTVEGLVAVPGTVGVPVEVLETAVDPVEVLGTVQMPGGLGTLAGNLVAVL
jgi:hypothetical protein